MQRRPDWGGVSWGGGGGGPGRWQSWSPGPRLASLTQWHGSARALAFLSLRCNLYAVCNYRLNLVVLAGICFYRESLTHRTKVLAALGGGRYVEFWVDRRDSRILIRTSA